MPDIYSQEYDLAVTTQGPLYPPAEVMDSQGNFVVVGMIPNCNGIKWDGAIVSSASILPEFGEVTSYSIIRRIDEMTPEELQDIILFTLPLPIPLNNYNMLFSPEQRPNANSEYRNSLPLHQGYISDYRASDGKRKLDPITLFNWLKAEGHLVVKLSDDRKEARFDFTFRKLVPNSLYTVMSLRECDLATENTSRPGPLGIPNVFITDSDGNADYWAILPNPFPVASEESNRVINVVVLFMSTQQSYGGAIGHYGLGGDIHAHLKLKVRSFDEFITLD
ncbi:hypothetical protein PSI19_07410 [Xenorhabdus khoisanae]|uniref:hypothetical protein n=1 Tax=Xenorhabdus khoisanae TaxID=880157 RepID=UPI0023584B9F|nr:hypothetical protein [Xenorhabdus khoisanae]MDC9613717.1 hypothetical protein [Xenorhabdus khoisanae]